MFKPGDAGGEAASGPGEHLAGGPVLDHPAVLDDDDPVGQQERVEDVVGDDDGADGRPAPGGASGAARARRRRRGRPWARRAAAGGGRRRAPGRPRPAGPGRRRAAPVCGRRTAWRRPRPASGRRGRGPRCGCCPTLRGPNATLSSALRCGNSSGSWASSATPRACAGTHTSDASVGRRRTGPGRRASPARCRAAAARRSRTAGRLPGAVRAEDGDDFAVRDTRPSASHPALGDGGGDLEAHHGAPVHRGRGR